jgi:hypothetical protein
MSEDIFGKHDETAGMLALQSAFEDEIDNADNRLRLERPRDDCVFYIMFEITVLYRDIG